MINKTAVLLGAIASVFVSVQARAGITGGNPAPCVATTSANAAKFDYGRNGVFNHDGSTSADLVCGLVRLSSSSPRNLFIDYWDGTSIGRISCYVAVRGWDGTPVWSQTQMSTFDAAKVGGTFSFSLPSSAVGYVVAVCTVPPIQAGQASGIDGFNIQ